MLIVSCYIFQFSFWNSKCLYFDLLTWRIFTVTFFDLSVKHHLKFVFFPLQKFDALHDGMVVENESQKDPSVVSSDLFHDARHKRSSSRWNEEFSPASSTVTDSTQAGELISRSKLTAVKIIFLYSYYFSLCEFIFSLKFSESWCQFNNYKKFVYRGSKVVFAFCWSQCSEWWSRAVEPVYIVHV